MREDFKVAHLSGRKDVTARDARSPPMNKFFKDSLLILVCLNQVQFQQLFGEKSVGNLWNFCRIRILYSSQTGAISGGARTKTDGGHFFNE
jgi:hypothetical protein